MEKPIDTLLDGVPCESLGISITNRPIIPSPQQKVDSYEIEGRHGSLTKLGAFKDIAFAIEYNILEMQNIKPLLRNIRGFFHGKRTLQFSDDTVYYKIKSVQIGETNNEIEQYGRFTVIFVCDPFQYEIIETITISEAITLVNPGTIESEPVMKIYGTGEVFFTVNGETFGIKNLNDYVVVDSTLLESYRENISWNDNMTGDFPVFKVGENVISWAGNITKIDIEPGWRYK